MLWLQAASGLQPLERNRRLQADPWPGARHQAGAAADQKLLGKLFADKGYIGQKLAQELLRRGLTLFTRIRKNMRALPLAVSDKLLLNARNMAETIIGSIKQFSSLNLPRHRLPLNAFLHLLAAITAYQINPIKPRFKLPSTSPHPLAISA